MTALPTNETESREILDGGPAFPCATDQVVVDQKGERVHIVMRGGMSLRDYFAGQALANYWFSTPPKEEEISNDQIASEVYAVADAMLRQREVPHV